MSTADQWNDQRARDRGENYYSGEQALERHLAATRRQSEAEAAQAKAAWDASAEGELQAIADSLAVAGAMRFQAPVEMATPAEWEQAQRDLGNDPATPKPTEFQLPIHLRQRVHDERLANLLRERTQS